MFSVSVIVIVLASVFTIEGKKIVKSITLPELMHDEVKRPMGIEETRKIMGECKDYNEQQCRVWAKAEQCIKRPRYMAKHCGKACACFGLGDGDSSTGTVTSGECKDSNQHCPIWASAGECTNNAGYMNKNCRKSCGCQTTGTTTGGGTTQGGGGGGGAGTCKDHYDPARCQTWAKLGECTKSPEFMNPNCAKSCGCPNGSGGELKCKNKYKDGDCEGWKNSSYCTIRRDWMVEHCALACGCIAPNPTQPTVTGTGSCKDKQASCAAWKAVGECHLNHGWMSNDCPESCGRCLPHCVDEHKNALECQQWMHAGNCQKRRDWMEPNCRRSCGLC